MGTLKYRVNFFFKIEEVTSCLVEVVLFFLNLAFFFFNLEMAQLGNYDSGTAETPETDESVSVSIFLDEIWCWFFSLSASGDLECVNYFISSINMYCASMCKA